MKITKFGHCCLLIEEGGLRILTDPGFYTTAQNEVAGIDVLLITHEHQDHLHIESVKEILKKNQPQIITNSAVKTLLEKEGITGNIKVVEDGQSCEVGGVTFAAHGNEHAIIHAEWPSVQNTGYFIGPRLFYPGDALYDPKKPIDILALPVAAPWLKISEAIDYAIALSPNSVFPVHDGILHERLADLPKRIVGTILEKHSIKYLALEIGKETEI